MASLVDPIKELRLRRWAREHYVSSEQRMSHWHPIVLEEMALRDLELDAFEQEVLSPYVPLMPTTHMFRHDAHEAVPAPAFLSARVAECPIYIPG